MYLELAAKGSTLIDLASGDNFRNRQAMIDGLKSSIIHQKTVTHELEYKDPKGRWGTYEVRFAPIPGSDPPQAILVSTEITVRKQAELALVRRDLESRALVDALPDLTYVVDRDLKILHSGGTHSIGAVFAPPIGFEIADAIAVALETKTVQTVFFQEFRNKASMLFEARIAVLDAERCAVFVRDMSDWRTDFRDPLSVRGTEELATGNKN